jgi:hypothetical protein
VAEQALDVDRVGYKGGQIGNQAEYNEKKRSRRWSSSMTKGAGETWYFSKIDLAFFEYGQ